MKWRRREDERLVGEGFSDKRPVLESVSSSASERMNEIGVLFEGHIAAKIVK